MKTLYVLLLLVPGLIARAESLELSNVFTRNMVLQREARNPVFGMAEPGAEVTVSLNGQEKTATADANGNWLAWLDPMPPTDQGQELVVRSGGRTEKVQGIVIGDVWLAAGDFALAKEMNPVEGKRVDGENEPGIRMYLCRMEVSPYPMNRHTMSSMYQLADQQGLKKFSSVLYAFARTLRQAENVPVGFFNSSGRFSLTGAMPAQAARYLQHPENQSLAAAMRETLLSEAEGKAAYSSFVRDMRSWAEDARQRLTAGRYPGRVPELPNAQLAFGGEYNARVHPVRLFPIRGVIWYYHDRDNYRGGQAQAVDRYRALIQSWRDAFNNPDLPFYIVQQHHANGVETNPSKHGALPLIQGELLKLPHTGLAATYDLADRKGWDLENRFEAGQRLALWAMRDVEPQGPTFGGVSFRDNKALVSFEHAEAGLMAAAKRAYASPEPTPDAPVSGFVIAGADKKFHWAEARIVQDNEVLVWSDEVGEPAYVAYAVNNSPDKPNLYSKDGLPTLPFSTGKEQP